MFRITRENDRFIATGPFPADELEAAGWFVYPTQRKARTARPAVVAPYLEYCDDEARRHVEISQRQLSVEDSWAAAAEIEVPCPTGVAYRDYQLAGIKYMSERWGSLNADVPRLGKTIQTAGVINLAHPVSQVLVICPAIAKVGWEREMKRWLVDHTLTVGVCYGDDLPDDNVIILNYELLARHAESLQKMDWDIVVCDEAHYLGNPKSKRTKTAMSFRPKKHFICLTGTPAFTRPIQLWPMVKKLDPQGIGKNWMTFTRRYCNGHNDFYGRYDTSGYSNLDELQLKMRKAIMVRREKRDVLDELPPMRKTVHIPSKGLKKLIKAERDAFGANLVDLITRLSNDTLDGDSPAAKMLEAAEERRALAMAKVPHVMSYISDLLDNNDKVIVFYHHRDPLDAFYKSFDPRMIARVWGGMTAKQREHERVAFQEDASCKIFVANLQAASTAIELSASDVVVFAEFARAVPSEYDQAEERAWLPTKETPIEIHNLVVEGSVEEDVAEALEYRRAQLERLTCRANL